MLTEVNEPWHDKINKMACALSEDSDQPGHPPSLIWVFAVRMKKPWVLSYPLSTQRRLIRLGRCTGWSESSLGAQVILLVLSWGGSYILTTSSSAKHSVLELLEVFLYKYGYAPWTFIDLSSQLNLNFVVWSTALSEILHENGMELNGNNRQLILICS